MVTWDADGDLPRERLQSLRRDLSEAWAKAGILEVYGDDWDIPEDLETGQIGGVSYFDVYRRGRWRGGGGPEAEAVEQLFEQVFINLWPFAKVVGGVTTVAFAGGMASKAGGDAWEFCKSRVKPAVRHILEVCARAVRLRVVTETDPDRDLIYHLDRQDLSQLDDAVDAIFDHARAAYQAPGMRRKPMRWDALDGELQVVASDD